jgi:hypothetical protein
MEETESTRTDNQIIITNEWVAAPVHLGVTPGRSITSAHFETAMGGLNLTLEKHQTNQNKKHSI